MVGDERGYGGGFEGITVREATFGVLRRLGMTTVFGNPGSTELPFLKDFPEDFEFILGLEESAVVGMADGYAQGRGEAVLVNLHTAPGLGNAMGAIVTAFHTRRRSSSPPDSRIGDTWLWSLCSPENSSSWPGPT